MSALTLAGRRVLVTRAAAEASPAPPAPPIEKPLADAGLALRADAADPTPPGPSTFMNQLAQIGPWTRPQSWPWALLVR